MTPPGNNPPRERPTPRDTDGEAGRCETKDPGPRRPGHVGQARQVRVTRHALRTARAPCPARSAPDSPAQALPARMPTHRTTVSSAHQRFGGVWWLLIVRSALEPDSQVVQPRGGAGKHAHTRKPAPAQGRQPNPTEPPPQQAAPGARGGPATPTERARRAAPQRESRGAAARPPRRAPPAGPQTAGAPAPTPPEAEGPVPPPPCGGVAPERGAGARPAPPPEPPAPAGTAGNKRTCTNAPRRHTVRAQRWQASTKRSVMGATPSMTRTTPALLPAQGRQSDGTRQSDPPPHWPPRPHKRGARRTGSPPPPHPPARECPGRADPPHEGRATPSQVGGKRDRAAPPPQAHQTEHGTGAGHAEGHGPR